jgi:hypothetical protein
MFPAAFDHLRRKNSPEKHRYFFIFKKIAAVLNRRKKKTWIFFQTEAFAAVIKPPVTLSRKFEIKKTAENSNKTAENFAADENRRKLCSRQNCRKHYSLFFCGGLKLPVIPPALFFCIT